MCEMHEEVDDDRGPWQVDIWSDKRVVIQSHDFSDAALEISGNFACFEQKVEYAHKLCERMNKMEGTRPWNWIQLEREKRNAQDQLCATEEAYATKESN